MRKNNTSIHYIHHYYNVLHVHEDIVNWFTWLLEELQSKKTDTVKTVVFCQSIGSCANLRTYMSNV